MAIESASDRAAYMSTFGIPVVIDGTALTGIYDNVYLADLEVSTSTPVLMIVTADKADVAYGDSVVIASESFSGTVREVQPDGSGMSVLLLGSST